MTEHGLLLVNLGSPTTPTAPAVKEYLNEFLGDANVVTLPRWFWQPLLRGMILPMRSPKSAARYKAVWLPEGSPLIVYSQRLTRFLPTWNVRLAMTYGEPSLEQTIRKMQQECRQLTVFPLFPHYTKSTAASIINRVHALDPTIKVIKHFADEPAFIDLLAKRINDAWQAGNYDMLFLSYHGIPASMIKAGDPYQEETRRTTAALRQRLAIPTEQVKMVYQSKFGPMPWLKPYLKNTLIQQAQLELRQVLVVSPSFVTDCLETLEENGIQNAQAFCSHGGEQLTMMPAFNDHHRFAQLIADLAQREAQPLAAESNC